MTSSVETCDSSRVYDDNTHCPPGGHLPPRRGSGNEFEFVIGCRRSRNEVPSEHQRPERGRKEATSKEIISLIEDYFDDNTSEAQKDCIKGKLASFGITDLDKIDNKFRFDGSFSTTDMSNVANSLAYYIAAVGEEKSSAKKRLASFGIGDPDRLARTLGIKGTCGNRLKSETFIKLIEEFFSDETSSRRKTDIQKQLAALGITDLDTFDDAFRFDGRFTQKDLDRLSASLERYRSATGHAKAQARRELAAFGITDPDKLSSGVNFAPKPVDRIKADAFITLVEEYFACGTSCERKEEIKDKLKSIGITDIDKFAAKYRADGKFDAADMANIAKSVAYYLSATGSDREDAGRRLASHGITDPEALNHGVVLRKDDDARMKPAAFIKLIEEYFAAGTTCGRKGEIEDKLAGLGITDLSKFSAKYRADGRFDTTDMNNLTKAINFYLSAEGEEKADAGRRLAQHGITSPEKLAKGVEFERKPLERLKAATFIKMIEDYFADGTSTARRQEIKSKLEELGITDLDAFDNVFRYDGRFTDKDFQKLAKTLDDYQSATGQDKAEAKAKLASYGVTGPEKLAQGVDLNVPVAERMKTGTFIKLIEEYFAAGTHTKRKNEIRSKLHGMGITNLEQFRRKYLLDGSFDAADMTTLAKAVDFYLSADGDEDKAAAKRRLLEHGVSDPDKLARSVDLKEVIEKIKPDTFVKLIEEYFDDCAPQKRRHQIAEKLKALGITDLGKFDDKYRVDGTFNMQDFDNIVKAVAYYLSAEGEDKAAAKRRLASHGITDPDKFAEGVNLKSRKTEPIRPRTFIRLVEDYFTGGTDGIKQKLVRLGITDIQKFGIKYRSDGVFNALDLTHLWKSLSFYVSAQGNDKDAAKRRLASQGITDPDKLAKGVRFAA